MQRFARAIDYIEDHLEDIISLDDVAAAAGVSVYHFARSFRAISGESVMSYVRRRRLTLAAEKLGADPSLRILDLALTCGFESQEAFTRAFKKRFALAPGQWQREGRRPSHARHSKLDLSLITHRQENITMEPTFTETEEIKVIGIMANFNEDTKSGIPELWTGFGPRMGEIKARLEGCTYGVCFPAVLGDDNFDYMAAVPVSSFDEIPEGMVARTIPPHKYAVFTHKMGEDSLHNDLQKSVQYIWGTWLPSSGFEHARVPDFELYDERMDPVTGKGEFDLYLPIK